MRNLIAVFVLLFSLSSFAQELEPFINFLRSTPAFINGEVAFVGDTVFYEEGWTIVKMVKNQTIEFSFQENWLEVRPGNSFYVKYAGLRVYIDKVTWTPQKGTQTESRVPADITGLSRGYVSREVAKIIHDLFGEKLKRANRILNTVRTTQTVGSIFEKAKSIVYIFTRDGEGPGVSLPKYRGEIGLNFLPPKTKGFNMYGTRVTVHGNDHYRSGFSFTGDNKGIYPYRIHYTSRNGTDINTGKEWKALARLVLASAVFDQNGIDLGMHLGATQIITAMCPKCSDSAQFPSIRVQVESYVRAAMMEQVKAYWSYLPGLNVSRNVMASFLRREKCRENNLVCLKNARRDPQETKACSQTFRACMR